MQGGTGIKVLWYREGNTTNTALGNTIRPTAASNEMFASWVNPIKNPCDTFTKRPKTGSLEATPYRNRINTIITLRELGNIREIGNGILMRVPHSGL